MSRLKTLFNKSRQFLSDDALSRCSALAGVVTRSVTQNKPKRVAIHIGSHKTGTSLVQHYMRENVPTVAAHGISYISRGDMNDYIGWGDKIINSPGKLRRRLDKELSAFTCRYVFMSHENAIGRPFSDTLPGLYPFARENMEAIASALQGYDATIILTIRPEAGFLESYYLQTIHQGGTQTFEQWVAGIDIENIPWRPAVDAVRAAFSKQRVHVIDFRSIARGQNAFLRDFITCIDPDIKLQPHYTAASNPSISEKGLSMALAINPFLETHAERKSVRKFLQRRFSNKNYERPKLLDDDVRKQLDSRYMPDYEKLLSQTD
jgi:hypothetical protein